MTYRRIYNFMQLFAMSWTCKTIQNTPNTNTEMLWGRFLFLFLYNFFLQYVFFLQNFLILRLNILSLITASTEMWFEFVAETGGC